MSEVVLSERNLLALLAKLHGYPSDSVCTLEVPTADGGYCVVRAVLDTEKYADRAPGLLDPDTAAFVAKLRTVL